MIRTTIRLLALGAALLCALAAGCSSKSHNNAPADPGKAREALKAALDSWKKGDKIDAMQSASPPIYVIDPEWQEGATLKDYQLVGDGEVKDAHLFCTVRLTVRGSEGQESAREVVFIVSTAPNITVSRKIF